MLYTTDLKNRLQTESRHLRMISRSSDSLNETAIARVSEILKYERRIDVLNGMTESSESIDAAIGRWLMQYRDCARELDLTSLGSDRQRVENLRQTILRYLILLQHKAVAKPQAQESYRLDEKYYSVLDDRRLMYASSDSDRARLVFAHAMALLEVSLREGGHHPGFLLLDEPLQQNPDSEHRSAFLSAIEALWPQVTGQVIIATSLQEEESEELAAAGVSIESMDDYFLQLE